MPNIYKGQDATFTITVQVDGTAVNLTTFDNVTCFAIDQNNNILDQWSRETLTGYNTLTQLNQTTDTGKFTVNLADTLTKLSSTPEGVLTFEIKTIDSIGQISEAKILTDSNGAQFTIENFLAKNKNIEP